MYSLIHFTVYIYNIVRASDLITHNTHEMFQWVDGCVCMCVRVCLYWSVKSQSSNYSLNMHTNWKKKYNYINKNYSWFCGCLCLFHAIFQFKTLAFLFLMFSFYYCLSISFTIYFWVHNVQFIEIVSTFCDWNVHLCPSQWTSSFRLALTIPEPKKFNSNSLTTKLIYIYMCDRKISGSRQNASTTLLNRIHTEFHQI